MGNKNSTLFLPIILIAGGLLFLIGAGVYYFGIFRQVAVPEPAIQVIEDTYENIPRVSLTDAKAAYDTRSAVFVDVRDNQSYAQRHVSGALSIPLTELPDRVKELNANDWIITYCT
jgi:hypothetical protein